MTRSEFAGHRLLADPVFARLKDYLIQATGLAYYADKDANLADRVARRLTALGLHDCASYLALLAEEVGGAAELDTLIEDLTIGETFFFRHSEMFDALRDIVLPDVLARNRDSRRLRVWSAGCSIGAEPYSLALLLRRDLAAQVAGWDISIVGTDINREFLARGREGRFEEWALRSTSEELKRACFIRSGKSWILAPEHRQGVSFQYHNLVTHPFPSLLNDLCDFDLILCRNVTIYFSADIVRRIIDHFHQCLVEGGWLGVGHAEPNLELFRSFRTVNTPGAILYQKSRDQGSAVAPFAAPPTWSWALPASAGLNSGAALASVERKAPGEQQLPLPTAHTAAPSDLDRIRALANRGAWAEAARACEAGLVRDNLTAAVHFYHGLVLEQMGQHTEAERALRRVLYLDRNHILAHYYLGLLSQRQGLLAQAARSFTNVLQLLGRVEPATIFAEGDGITAAELAKLTQMHLEVLEKA